MKQQLDTIRSVLRNAQKDVTKGVITKEFVTRYIDKIFATPEEDVLCGWTSRYLPVKPVKSTCKTCGVKQRRKPLCHRRSRRFTDW